MSSSSRRSLYMVSLIASLFVSPSVEAFVGCKSNFIGGLNILDTARRRGSSSISQLQMNLPGQVSKKVIVTGACMSSCYMNIFDSIICTYNIYMGTNYCLVFLHSWKDRITCILPPRHRPSI